MPEIKLVNLTKKYGRIKANDNISLTIKNKEYISIIGPSGCGKTTLIKNIAGIIKPDTGKIYIGNRLVNNLPIEDRGIGYVFQNIALFPHMTVWDNIVYGPKVKGLSQKKTRPLALNMLEMIRISERSDSFPYELSGGTQQKTAVARALLSRAKLLLLDEPLGALDLKVRAELRYELKDLVKELELTALHVTHDQEEAMSISDRVIVMKNGRIIEAGTPLELYSRPKNIFTANFIGEANFLTGIIKGINKNGCNIKVGDFHLNTERQEGCKGERVVLAFRPEFAFFTKKGKFNIIKGEVVDTIYSGSIARLIVELVNGDKITVKKALTFERIQFKPGELVKLSILPKDILVFPYPEKGLHKELELE